MIRRWADREPAEEKRTYCFWGKNGKAGTGLIGSGERRGTAREAIAPCEVPGSRRCGGVDGYLVSPETEKGKKDCSRPDRARRKRGEKIRRNDVIPMSANYSDSFPQKTTTTEYEGEKKKERRNTAGETACGKKGEEGGCQPISRPRSGKKNLAAVFTEKNPARKLREQRKASKGPFPQRRKGKKQIPCPSGKEFRLFPKKRRRKKRKDSA